MLTSYPPVNVFIVMTFFSLFFFLTSSQTQLLDLNFEFTDGRMG